MTSPNLTGQDAYRAAVAGLEPALERVVSRLRAEFHPLDVRETDELFEEDDRSELRPTRLLVVSRPDGAGGADRWVNVLLGVTFDASVTVSWEVEAPTAGVDDRESWGETLRVGIDAEWNTPEYWQAVTRRLPLAAGWLDERRASLAAAFAAPRLVSSENAASYFPHGG